MNRNTKKALKVIEGLYNVVKYQSSYDALLTFKTLEKAFPELHENEDERIRKEILSIVKSYRESCITEGNHRFDDCISWLEKQGEQKTTTQYNYVKFREGDTVQKITGDKNIVTIAEVDTEAEVYRLTNTGFIPFKYEHLWRIVEQKSSWSEDDEEKFRDVIRLVEQGVPVQSIRDHYTNWLKSLKDRFQLQPKQEWNEEEEEELTEFEKAIYQHICTMVTACDGKVYCDEILKPVVKGIAKDLLDLARKEIEKKYRIIDKDDSDWEDGYKQGKQDALKDLPKWKRDCFHNINSAVDGRLYYNGYYIDINELKLPKEE